MQPTANLPFEYPNFRKYGFCICVSGRVHFSSLAGLRWSTDSVSSDWNCNKYNTSNFLANYHKLFKSRLLHSQPRSTGLLTRCRMGAATSDPALQAIVARSTHFVTLYSILEVIFFSFRKYFCIFLVVIFPAELPVQDGQLPLGRAAAGK